MRPAITAKSIHRGVLARNGGGEASEQPLHPQDPEPDVEGYGRSKTESPDRTRSAGPTVGLALCGEGKVGAAVSSGGVQAILTGKLFPTSL